MGGQLGSSAMGSLVSLVKFGRFNGAKKGDWEVNAMETCEDMNLCLERGLFCDVPYCEFSWLLIWDVILCPPGDEGGVVCGLVLGDRPGFPTKDAPTKDEPMMVATFRL